MDYKITLALQRMKETRYDIKNKQVELRELREVAGSVPAVSGNVDKGGGGSGDRTSSLAIRIVSLEEEIAGLQEKYMRYETQLRNAIERLPAIECHILTMKFIGNMDFDEIAAEIDYSERQMFRIYNKAKKHLAELIDDVSECQ